MSRRRFWVNLLVLAVALAAVSLLGMCVGAVMQPPADVLRGIADGDALIWRYRVPRIAVGICAGAAMAAAGCLLQTALRNPLAAPDTVGITAGGGLAAVAALLGFGPLPASSLTAVAFGGALAGAALVMALAGRGTADPIRLTLTGVAVSFGLGAVTHLLLVRSAPEAGAAMTWLKGSLYARTLDDARAVGPVILIAFVAAMVAANHIDMLGLDDATMAGVGVAGSRWRIAAVVLASVLGAGAVAAAGVLGFVGLIVPQAARLVVGPRLRYQLPTAALGGAVLVTGCDTLGRWAFAPTEIPVGALIAIVGSPYFIYLLVKLGKGVRQE